MTFSTRHATGPARDLKSERTEMRMLFLISFPVCLIAVTANRIAHSLDKAAARPAQSIFAEARASAYAAVGYAFHV